MVARYTQTKAYKHWPKTLLFAIFLVGFLIRVFNLSGIPPGFFADEAAIGYNAYKLLTTGADEYGIPWPFYFRSFGDYRTPVAIYSMIPLIAALGLNETSVRLTMVLYGTLTVLALYLLAKQIFWELPETKTEIVALSSAFLLAISPWHIQFSRTGFEFIPMPFYLLLGLYFLFKFIRIGRIAKKNNGGKNLLLASFFLIICFYTAYVVELVLFPFLLVILIIYHEIFFFPDNRKIVLISAVVFALGIIPFIVATESGQALARFNSVSPIAQGKNLKQFLLPMAKTYLDHFSVDFLFTKGDISMPGHPITRHSVRDFGELYFFQLPLIIGGISFLIKDRRASLFFLAWFLLYPVGSTVIAEGPFAHRSLFGVIPFQIISALGVVRFLYLLKARLVKIVLILSFTAVLVYSISIYSTKIFAEYPLYSANFWGWQYGPREIMAYFLKNKDRYDDLYMSGEFNGGHIFLQFYDPTNLCQNKCKLGDLWRNTNIYKPERRQLFSLSPEYLRNSGRENSFKIDKTIYYPNGEVAFLIGEVTK